MHCYHPLRFEGTGFDAATTSANALEFLQQAGPDIKGLVARSTQTELVVSFTHLAPTNQNASGHNAVLSTIIVSGIWSGHNRTASIAAARPTITSSQACRAK